MDFNYTVYKKKNLVPSIWDGGKTYEYRIFPETSDYADKDFLFRISSASIEKVPSGFTRFPGYTRFLVMLDNNLELVRNGIKEHYTPQDVFVFDSNDEIVSNSLGNDFNLMVRHDITDVQVQLSEGNVNTDSSCVFFFSCTKTCVDCGDFKLELEPYDLAVIENPRNVNLMFFTDEIIITGSFYCDLF